MSFQDAYQDTNKQNIQNKRSNQEASLSTINLAPCNVEFDKYSSTTDFMRTIK